MADQEFQNKIFEALSGLESRLEKRLDSIEAERKEDNERLEKRFDSLDARLEAIDTRVGGVERDVGWIRGKLEDRQESRSRILLVFSNGATIAAVIIALIALSN